MTEDEITRGSRQRNRLTGETYEAVAQPAKVESVIATLDGGGGAGDELWKLSHYYERLDDEDGVRLHHGPRADGVEDEWELYNLTADPEERRNLDATGATGLALQRLLRSERDTKRLVPRLGNAG